MKNVLRYFLRILAIKAVLFLPLKTYASELPSISGFWSALASGFGLVTTTGEINSGGTKGDPEDETVPNSGSGGTKGDPSN